LENADVLMPEAIDPASHEEQLRTGALAFARLKPGVTIEQATAAMEPLFQQML